MKIQHFFNHKTKLQIHRLLPGHFSLLCADSVSETPARLLLLTDVETEFVYRVYQYAEMLGINRLVNAVAEVEDVARMIAEAGDDLACLGANALGVGVENAGIEIALQRNAITHTFARSINIDGPVQSKRVAAAVSHYFQPLTAALGEQGYWNRLPLVFAFQAGDDPRHVVE
jgi:hypothetical protein